MALCSKSFLKPSSLGPYLFQYFVLKWTAVYAMIDHAPDAESRWILWLTLRIIQEDFKRELPNILSVQNERLEESEQSCSAASQYPFMLGPITREITAALGKWKDLSTLQAYRLLMSFLSTDEPNQ
jgi:hypothetical protein